MHHVIFPPVITETKMVKGKLHPKKKRTNAQKENMQHFYKQSTVPHCIYLSKAYRQLINVYLQAQFHIKQDISNLHLFHV